MAELIQGRYRIEEVIGTGAMGEVHRAVDEESGYAVAIKTLRPGLVERNPDMLSRFEREGRTLRQLRHPNIVIMLDAFEEDGNHYIVMEYVTGGDLHDLIIKLKRLSIHHALSLTLELADALTRAHHLKIIHRDIKLANVLIAEDGTPRLTDFGVAHVASGSSITEVGTVIGTYAYLSPEACMAQTLDARSDIWSFGVILYELLIGERPFHGNSPGAVIASILHRPIPHLGDYRDDIPEDLRDLIYRMLSKNRDERIPTMRMVGAEIERILNNLSTTKSKKIGRRVKLPTTGQLSGSLYRARTPTMDSQIGNLPAETTPFIGREKELEDIKALIRGPDCRLLTLLGPGGMGKTRLGIAAAEALSTAYINGVYYIPLAPVTQSENIPQTIAESLDIRLSGNDDPQSQLIDYLRDRSILLILDNVEQVIEGAELIHQILDQAPMVNVLATSRSRLNLLSECVYEVGGMAIPKLDTFLDIENFDSVKMFVAYVRRVRPGYTLTAADQAGVIKICNLVDGMPLGLELAATWANTLPPMEIAEELEADMDFLETEMRDIPERHRSIRVVLDNSWALLSESEREVFKRLSIFKGGFERKAAQEVAQTKLRPLQSLVNKSLLRRDPQSGRYRIHEMLRQYAEDRLDQDKETANETRARHADFYITFLAEKEDGIESGNIPGSTEDFINNLDNIRSAWAWIVDEGDLNHLLRGGYTLFSFYQYQSRYQEGIEIFERTSKRLKEMEDSSKRHRAYYESLLYEGWLAMRLGLFEDSDTALMESYSLMIKHDIPPRPGLATDPRAALGMLRVLEGDYVEAMHYGEILQRESAENNNQGNLVFAHYVMVGAELALGHYEEAKRHGEIALDMLKRQNARWITAYILAELGRIERILGSYDTAKTYFLESYSVRRQFKDNQGMANALNELGSLAQAEENYPEAMRLYHQSIEHYRNVGDKGGIGEVLLGMGNTARSMGALDEARLHFRESLKLAHAIAYTPLIVSVAGMMAELVLQGGQQERAVSLLAFTMNHPTSNQQTKDFAVRLLGDLKTKMSEDAFTEYRRKGVSLSVNSIVEDLLTKD